VTMLCRIYGVSPRSFYSWIERGKSDRESEDEELIKHIIFEFYRSDEIYGSPKIHKELQKQGIFVAQKRVARLMREHGLQAKKSRIYRLKPGTKKFYSDIPNVVWSKEITGPNQVWVGDITFIKVSGEWHYLAMVLDVFSRKIIGWSLGWEKSAELTVRALKSAVKNRGLHRGLIFHSDRGAEYGAYRMRKVLENYGIQQSMNRVDVMNDNAYIESFFLQLKTERIKGREFNTESDLRKTIQDYELWYNCIRSHSSIGYLSPDQYESIVY